MSLIKSLNPVLIQMILLFPKSLGGYSIPLLSDFMSQGFPDPLLSNLAMLSKIRKESPDLNVLERILLDRILSVDYETTVNYELLCQDPLSLNLQHPSTPKERIRRGVMMYLATANWIQNLRFQEYFVLAEGKQT